MKVITVILLSVIYSLIITSCETTAQRQDRIVQIIKERKEQARLDSIKFVKDEKDRKRSEKQRKEREEAERQRLAKLEIERKKREKEQSRKEAELRRYRNNQLATGSTPWSSCYGINKSCSSWGCSQIKVQTPYSSDVIVTIKEYGDVVRHAYIRKNSSYTIELPDGTYQPFFYYGNGWNPNKTKKSKSCGSLPGAFISGEDISKDRSQTLNNSVLTYELILQQNGNLRTQSSNEEEAF